MQGPEQTMTVQFTNAFSRHLQENFACCTNDDPFVFLGGTKDHGCKILGGLSKQFIM